MPTPGGSLRRPPGPTVVSSPVTPSRMSLDPYMKAALYDVLH